MLGEGFPAIRQQEEEFWTGLLGKSEAKSKLWEARSSFLLGESTGHLCQLTEMHATPGLLLCSVQRPEVRVRAEGEVSFPRVAATPLPLTLPTDLFMP